MSKVVWYTPSHGKLNGKIKEWARYVARADDGTIYVPALLAGNEMAVMLCASYDGTKVLLDDKNHSFYPLEWMAREFPHTADACAKIKALVPEWE